MTTLSPRADLDAITAVTLPSPRGPLTDWLLDHLRRPPHELVCMPTPGDDPITGDDSGLALYLCYEQHYQGLPDVDEGWEWEPSLLAVRRQLERAFERRLVELVGHVPIGVSADVAVATLRDLARPGDGRSLSEHMAEAGTVEQLRELAVHRSAYQLKEADPHTWGIPRLTGRPKAALVDIQWGEYGEGDPAGLHAQLFADTIDELSLDSRYGAYLDLIPGVTLSTCNLISLFGLHRAWRGALVGHLALFEMCSVQPMGRYLTCLQRLGFGARATRFYEEHIVADERHERVAIDDMVIPLVQAEPFLGGEVVHGARCLTAIEGLFASHVMGAWDAGTTSLRRPLT